MPPPTGVRVPLFASRRAQDPAMNAAPANELGALLDEASRPPRVEVPPPPPTQYFSSPDLRVMGNVDMATRPAVRNADGTVSSVRSMSIGTDDGDVLIPTVSDDGRVLSDDDAIRLYEQTGRHLGIFGTPEGATAYAEELHNREARRTAAGRTLGDPRGALGALVSDADAAERAARGRLGGIGASAPIADRTAAMTALLEQSPQPIAPPIAVDAVPQAERAGVLGLLRRPAPAPAPAAAPAGDVPDPVLLEALAQRRGASPAPAALPADAFDLDAAAQRAAEIEAAPVPAPAPAPPAQATIGGPLQIPVGPLPAALPTGPASRIGMHGVSPQRGPADVADLTGGAGTQAATTPGAMGRGRMRRGFRAPAAPPTEEEINQALISELTGRPAGDAPLVPGDFRPTSIADRQLQGIADRESFEQTQAEQAAIRAADVADQEAAVEEQRAAVQERRQAALAGARQRYEGALQRTSEMSIEPERFFRSRGALGQVGAAIAMAVGSLAEGISGTPNRAMQIIQSAVDRDIDAQRMGIENARAGAEGQRGLLGLMRQEFEDEDAAIDATRAAMLHEAARRAEIEGAQAQSQDARLRADAMRTELEAAARTAQEQAAMREALRLLEFRRTMADTVRAEGRARTALADATRAERRAAGGGARRPRNITQQQLETYNQLVNSDVAPEEAAVRVGIDFVPPSGVFSTGSGQEAAGLAALDEALRAIESRLPAEGEDIPGVGAIAGRLPNFLVSDEGEALREELTNAVDLIGRLRSGGAISEDEEERFARILGGTTGQSEASLRRGLARVRRELRGRVQRRIHNRGRGEELDRQSSAVGFTPEGSE